jgi:hypothetical protein
MTPDTRNVPMKAGISAHFLPTTSEARLRVGLYTAGRKIFETMRFHLLPHKSCNEVERYGLWMPDTRLMGTGPKSLGSGMAADPRYLGLGWPPDPSCMGLVWPPDPRYLKYSLYF